MNTLPLHIYNPHSSRFKNLVQRLGQALLRIGRVNGALMWLIPAHFTLYSYVRYSDAKPFDITLTVFHAVVSLCNPSEFVHSAVRR